MRRDLGRIKKKRDKYVHTFHGEDERIAAIQKHARRLEDKAREQERKPPYNGQGAQNRPGTSDSPLNQLVTVSNLYMEAVSDKLVLLQELNTQVL